MFDRGRGRDSGDHSKDSKHPRASNKRRRRKEEGHLTSSSDKNKVEQEDTTTNKLDLVEDTSTTTSSEDKKGTFVFPSEDKSIVVVGCLLICRPQPLLVRQKTAPCGLLKGRTSSTPS